MQITKGRALSGSNVPSFLFGQCRVIFPFCLPFHWLLGMSRQVDTLSLYKRIVFLGGKVTSRGQQQITFFFAAVCVLRVFIFLSFLLGYKIDNVLLICVISSGVEIRNMTTVPDEAIPMNCKKKKKKRVGPSKANRSDFRPHYTYFLNRF